MVLISQGKMKISSETLPEIKISGELENKTIPKKAAIDSSYSSFDRW